jgi:hypothetical protein
MLYFPDTFKPDRIQLKTPIYISSQKEFSQGTMLFKRTQFVGATTVLQLSYSFISQAELDSLLSLWDASQGVKVFELPSAFFNSYPSLFSTAITRLKSTKYWRMTRPEYTPKILVNNNGVNNRFNRYDVTLNISAEVS